MATTPNDTTPGTNARVFVIQKQNPKTGAWKFARQVMGVEAAAQLLIEFKLHDPSGIYRKVDKRIADECTHAWNAGWRSGWTHALLMAFTKPLLARKEFDALSRARVKNEEET